MAGTRTDTTLDVLNDQQRQALRAATANVTRFEAAAAALCTAGSAAAALIAWCAAGWIVATVAAGAFTAAVGACAASASSARRDAAHVELSPVLRNAKGDVATAMTVALGRSRQLDRQYHNTRYSIWVRAWREHERAWRSTPRLRRWLPATLRRNRRVGEAMAAGAGRRELEALLEVVWPRWRYLDDPEWGAVIDGAVALAATDAEHLEVVAAILTANDDPVPIVDAVTAAQLLAR